MPIVNEIDNILFEMNGIRYPRVFFAVPDQSMINSIEIYMIYDSTYQLLSSSVYTSFTVNGNNTWSNVAEVIAALQPVLSGGVMNPKTLSSLEDVNFSTLNVGDEFRYDGTHWYNLGNT